jgi:Autotransporter beta-domain
MTNHALRYGSVLAFGLAVAPLLGGGFATRAEAQIFCPTAVGNQPNIALNAAFCTNGKTGALSTAALSSQSLSEVTESTTQQTTTSNMQAIERRRNEEVQRCPDGSERVGGSCRRIPERESTTARRGATSSSQGTPSSQGTMAQPSGIVRQRHVATQAPPPMLYKAPPMIYEPVRYAVWGNGFGDYERRTGSSTILSGGIGGVGPGVGGAVVPLPVDLTRVATTLGFNAGIDATFRNVGWLGDILIAGVLTGYSSTHITINTASFRGDVDGPSLGGYVTYLNGPLSVDLLGRVDFLHLNESFSETLNFNLGAPAGTAVINSSGSTNLDNYVVAGNAYYRLITTPAWWLEPTAGFAFIQSNYDSSAAALGLASGHDWRVQGGVRVGSSFLWGGVLVTPTITGLAYSDVEITGQVISGGLFNVSPIIPLDEGKVRGQGIFNVNFDYGNGWSGFVLGDIRGGSDLFAAGGKAGVRYQW